MSLYVYFFALSFQLSSWPTGQRQKRRDCTDSNGLYSYRDILLQSLGWYTILVLVKQITLTGIY